MFLDIEKVVKNGFEQAMEQYKSITGVTLKEAAEKQMPKKPNIPWDTQKPQCPICQAGFLGKQKHCSECGQAIDWSETEW